MPGHSTTFEIARSLAKEFYVVSTVERDGGVSRETVSNYFATLGEVTDCALKLSREASSTGSSRVLDLNKNEIRQE